MYMPCGNMAMKHIASLLVNMRIRIAGVGIAGVGIVRVERITVAGACMHVDILRAFAISTAVRMLGPTANGIYHVTARNVTPRIAVPASADVDVVVISEKASYGKDISLLDRGGSIGGISGSTYVIKASRCVSMLGISAAAAVMNVITLPQTMQASVCSVCSALSQIRTGSHASVCI